MDSQFRCGKCGKPISSKFSKCLDCGSLGPHTFTGSTGSALEGGPPADHKPVRRDSYPAERVDRPQPPASHLPAKYDEAPVDIEAASPHEHPLPLHDMEEDTKFPAGMRSRSPILDYVDDMDTTYDEDEAKKRRKKERDRDRDDEDEEDEDEDENEEDDDEDEDDEEELKRKRHSKTSAESPSSAVPWVVGIILILALIIATIYVINNFEELTRWLASPTIPEFFKPSE
ncbi:MAG: hypothetical protein JXA01_02725 [Dehalococcoidia bacterium]|nr:hypothetical protein [Dehalococcoidia bacterium]